GHLEQSSPWSYRIGSLLLVSSPSTTVEALQCKVCKYKLPLLGCFRGANETTCERREKCAIIKTSLGKVTLYYQQGCTSAMNCGRERAADAESRLTSHYSCCETDLCNEEWDEDPTD
uniref:UPAR/Ly6 domain-containing protein n=1 Tax=Anas platyrhynchos TaxID=8839 RepID=A0A8B9T1T2_ANAPL